MKLNLFDEARLKGKKKKKTQINQRKKWFNSCTECLRRYLHVRVWYRGAISQRGRMYLLLTLQWISDWRKKLISPSAKRLGVNRCEELAFRAKLTMKVAQFWSKSIEVFFPVQWECSALEVCRKSWRAMDRLHPDKSHGPGALRFHEPNRSTVICRKAADPLAAEETLLVLKIQAEGSHAHLSLSCVCLPSKTISGFFIVWCSNAAISAVCIQFHVGWLSRWWGRLHRCHQAGRNGEVVTYMKTRNCAECWSLTWKCPPRANEHASCGSCRICKTFLKLFSL